MSQSQFNILLCQNDSEVQGIETPEQVTQKLRQVKSHQEQFQPCHLYQRKWLKTSETGNAITVMQFNLLAEGLSSNPNLKPPFPVTKPDKGGGFGGFTLPNPEVSLDFNLRKWRLLEEISGGSIENSPDINQGQIMPDIIACQENDHHQDFFGPILQTYGFSSQFNPKTEAPGVPLGWYSDGCSIFWRESLFTLVSTNKGTYTHGSQGYLICCLRHKISQKLIIVATTHLKSKATTENETLRTQQITELCLKIEYIRDNFNEPSSTILLGDLNTDPCDTTINTRCVPVITQYNYLSVYPLLPLSEGDYTTWKVRGDKESKHVIDYIFTDNLKCIATLGKPDESEIEPTRLPGFRYPSDHLSLVAQFIL
jgi:nocturnin